MTSNSQFGIACKTCRRRGRKCDRTLPKCMSCHRRRVECEGYTLRWVGLAARGNLAGRTYQSATDDPTLRNAARVLERESYAHQYSHSANSTSSADGTNLHLVTSPRRPTWTMPAALLPPDSMQVFVKYCKDNFSWRILAITHGL